MATVKSELRFEFKIEPRDLWVGLYWKRSPFQSAVDWEFYVCPLPMVRLYWRWWHVR